MEAKWCERDRQVAVVSCCPAVGKEGSVAPAETQLRPVPLPFCLLLSLSEAEASEKVGEREDAQPSALKPNRLLLTHFSL